MGRATRSVYWAGKLLDRRVIGLPASVHRTLLCTVGRIAQGSATHCSCHISTVEKDSSELGLVDVTEDVVKDELRALKHRAMAQATSLEIPELPLFCSNRRSPTLGPPPGHTETSGTPSPATEIEAIMNNLSQLWAGIEHQHFTHTDGTGVSPPHSPLRSRDSFHAGLYFLLTVCQLFTAKADMVTKLVGCVTGQTFEFSDNALLKNLARARTTLGVNPYLAAEIIQDTRKDLCRTDYPIPLADIKPGFLKRSPVHHAGRPS